MTPNENRKTTDPQRNRNNLSLLIIGIVVVFLIVALGYWYSTPNNPSTAPSATPTSQNQGALPGASRNTTGSTTTTLPTS